MFIMPAVVITGSTTLRVLNVGDNEIGDDGISMISEELQHNNSLNELTVAVCGLSVNGEELIHFVFFACTSICEYCFLCYYLIPYMVTSVRYIIIVIVMITTGAIAVSELLVGNCTLQGLSVGHNAIGDDGISVIVEQLQYNTTLTKLYVQQCELSVKGTLVCVRCILVQTVRISYLIISVIYYVHATIARSNGNDQISMNRLKMTKTKYT